MSSSLRTGTLRFPTLASQDRTAEPVTFALPFAAGVLADASHFRLVDGEADVPVQAHATSTWQDGSVRWLYVRSQVDLPGRAGKSLTWRVASAPSPGEEEAGIAVQETPEGLVVDTGRLRALVPAGGGVLLRRIELDGAPIPGELASFSLRSEPVDGTTPGSGEGAPPIAAGPVAVTIEEQGALAAVVRLDGTHEGDAWRQRVRLTFHAGKPYVEVAHRFLLQDTSGKRRLTSLTLEWVPGADTAGSPGVPPRLTIGQGHYLTRIESGTEPRTASLSPEQLFGQEHTPELFYGDFWGSHTGASGGAALTIFQAFQNFPVALAVAPDRLRVSLVPEASAGHVIWPGMAKEHRLLVHLHGAGETLDALSFRSLQCQLPDEPVSPPETYAAAGVWPDVFPAQRSEALEWLLSRRADERSVALGMLDFGDGPDWGYTAQRRGGDNLVWTNNEYDFTRAMYLNWARTGERRFKGAADSSGRHWLDVDVCHASPDLLRLGGHVTHSAHHVSGGLAPSHQWVEGLIDYYHQSGDREALDAAIGIGENVLRLLAGERFQQAGGVQVRELGWALVAFAGLYEETRDERFMAESARLVEVFLDWQRELGGLIAPYTSHTLVRVPFMISVAVKGLLRYHALRPDPRIPTLVVTEVDAMIQDCLGPEGVFQYKALPSLHRPSANPLLLGLLAQSYRLTGERRYLELALTQLRWTLGRGPQGATGSGPTSGVVQGAFVTGGRSPGPKEFAQAFLPTMELYVAAAEAGMLP